jgi:hypothetical protein
VSEVGEACRNGPWQDIWTCPACYHDHHTEVTACASCATPLSCTTEREPVAVCTIVEAGHEQDDDE